MAAPVVGPEKVVLGLAGADRLDDRAGAATSVLFHFHACLTPSPYLVSRKQNKNKNKKDRRPVGHQPNEEYVEC